MPGWDTFNPPPVMPISTGGNPLARISPDYRENAGNPLARLGGGPLPPVWSSFNPSYPSTTALDTALGEPPDMSNPKPNDKGFKLDTTTILLLVGLLVVVVAMKH